LEARLSSVSDRELTRLEKWRVRGKLRSGLRHVERTRGNYVRREGVEKKVTEFTLLAMRAGGRRASADLMVKISFSE